MPEQFGSPKEHEFIASLERSMVDVGERTAKHFESVVDRIAPRAIGSERVLPDQRAAEYALTIAGTDDPVGAGEAWVREKANQYGLLKALELFADEVLENEKFLAERMTQ